MLGCPMYDVPCTCQTTHRPTDTMTPLWLPGGRRPRCRLRELAGVNRRVILHFLDVNRQIVGRTYSNGSNQVGNLHAADVPVIIVIRLNGIITERRCHGRRLTYEQSRLRIEEEPLGQVAIGNADYHVCVDAAHLLEAA